MNIKNNFKSFFKGFVYAFNGIILCIKSERNIRFHLCTAFYVLIFMRFYDFSKSEIIMLILLIASVIALEMVNTAIESIVDLCSPQYHSLAKKAKDTAAGAVLIIAVAALIIGVHLFWSPTTFKFIFAFFKNHLLALICLIASLILSFWFIFCFKQPEKNVHENQK